MGALGAHSEGGLRHDGGGRNGDEKYRHGHREAGRQGRVRHRASDVMSGVTSGERRRRTAWSVVLLLAMAYRGHLQEDVNAAEMAEIDRTEGPRPEPLAEAGSELNRVGYAVEGMLEIGTPVPMLAQERPMLVVLLTPRMWRKKRRVNSLNSQVTSRPARNNMRPDTEPGFVCGYESLELRSYLGEHVHTLAGLFGRLVDW